MTLAHLSLWLRWAKNYRNRIEGTRIETEPWKSWTIPALLTRYLQTDGRTDRRMGVRTAMVKPVRHPPPPPPPHNFVGGRYNYSTRSKFKPNLHILLTHLYTEFHSKYQFVMEKTSGNWIRQDRMTEGWKGITLYARTILWGGHKNFRSSKHYHSFNSNWYYFFIMFYLYQQPSITGWPQILRNEIPWNFPDFYLNEIRFPWPNMHNTSVYG